MADARPEEGASHNLQHGFAYQDLREWIAEADRLGELRVVTGASWQQDIGLACTLMKYSDDNPALLFDEIPGHRKGFRVLAGIFGVDLEAMAQQSGPA